MSKETVKHYAFGACHDENFPVCGAFGEYVTVISEATCEPCLKTMARMGKDALERAFELDYFSVKEEKRADNSDV